MFTQSPSEENCFEDSYQLLILQNDNIDFDSVWECTSQLDAMCMSRDTIGMKENTDPGKVAKKKKLVIFEKNVIQIQSEHQSHLLCISFLDRNEHNIPCSNIQSWGTHDGWLVSLQSPYNKQIFH